MHLDGVDLDGLTEDARAALRREKVGCVFQAFPVLSHLDIAQNVGLSGLSTHLPQHLSGGQLQSVVITRALVHRHTVLLADRQLGPHHRRKGDGRADGTNRLARRVYGTGDAQRGSY